VIVDAELPNLVALRTAKKNKYWPVLDETRSGEVELQGGLDPNKTNFDLLDRCHN
jgi:hypothetical protein